jgi:hypothetical protein
VSCQASECSAAGTAEAVARIIVGDFIRPVSGREASNDSRGGTRTRDPGIMRLVYA